MSPCATSSQRFRWVAVAATLLAASVQAATPADQAFEKGRKLLAQKKYAEACAAFEQSQVLEAGLGTLLNLANCNEKLGKLATAHRLFTEAATWAARTNETKRHAAALERAAALAPRLSLVAIEPDAANATLELVDEKPALSWTPDRTVALDPGPHRIAVSAPDRERVVVAIEVDSAGTTRLPVTLPPVKVAAVEPAPAPVPAPVVPAQPAPRVGVEQPKPAPSKRRPLAIAAIAAGGAVAIAGAVGVGYGAQLADRVRRQQPGGPDNEHPTVTRAEFDTVKTLYPISWVGLGVGVAAVGAGALLLKTESVSVGASASGTGAFVTVGGSF